MLTAAIDSTAVTASAAVAEINEGRLGKYSVYTVKNRLTHSETLLPMLDTVLHGFGAEISDIELFAVSAGPGSFTGVRIGVATLKGLATPRGVPCAGVSTLEAIAANIENGYVLPLMDARRGQFYTALFRDGARITEDSALGLAEITEMLHGLENVTVCGDGAGVFRTLCGEMPGVVYAAPAACDQNALSVALCGEKAYREGKAVRAKELRPIYLRLPQAERERLEREREETK